MNEYSIGQIDRFSQIVSEFRDAWQHLVLRAGWFQGDRAGSCAFLHADLLTDPPGVTAPDPSVPPFHAATVVQDPESLKSFLEDLKEDRVRLGSQTLRLAAIDNGGKVLQVFQVLLQMEASKHNPPKSRRGPATVRLQGGGLPVSGIFGENESIGAMEARWRALPQPYRGWDDVFSSYFDEPERRGSPMVSCFVTVNAHLPLDFSSSTTLSGRRLQVAVDGHPKVDFAKVSVGAILDRQAEPPLRSTIRWDASEWKVLKTKARATRSVPSQRASSATLFLRYGDAVLGQFTQDLPEHRQGNDVVKAHEVLDPDRTNLRRWLSGQGDEKGNRRGHLFEAAFVWLLHLLRLPAIPYGAETNEVDAVCILEDQRVALVVECTTALPDFKEKTAKLFGRARDLKKALSDYDFIPILATCLPSKDIPQDHLDRAAKDWITLLGGGELDALLKAAETGAKVEEVVAYLVRGGCAVRADSFEGRLGNRRQWTRGGWAKDG